MKDSLNEGNTLVTEMNERSMETNDRSSGRSAAVRLRTLYSSRTYHPWIRSQLPGQLSFSHIKSINLARAILQETIRESSGGGAQIGAHSVCDGNLKMIESRLQFDSRPAGERKLVKDRVFRLPESTSWPGFSTF